MKTTKILLSAVSALCLLAAPMTAFAEEEAPAAEPSADYEYELDAEGNAKLSKFKAADSFEGDVVIPSVIDGHPVNFLKAGCFMEARGITSITIPSTITDLGDDVFLGCTSLEKFYVEDGNPYFTTTDEGVLIADDNKFLVAYPAAKPDEIYTVPAGITEIAPGAFGFAQNMKEINIPEGVEFIDSWAFAHSNIEKVSIAGTVYQIDDYAFAFCEGLHEVNLGKGIEKIYHAAFANDKALTQITIPDTVTLIGQYAFVGTGLSCVTIPDSLETIDFCAFGYNANANLSEFSADPNFTIYGEPNTLAQEYCTTMDDENDYKNNFTFIAVEDASIPYELGGGKLYEEATDAEVTDAATDAQGETIAETAAAATNEAAPAEEIGAGLSENPRMKLILGIGGGVLIALAVVLFVVFAKKPKNKENHDAK